DPGAGARRTVYGRVDADQSPRAVEQGTAGIAWIDGGASLQYAVDWAAGQRFHLSIERADHPLRESDADAERVADGIGILPDLETLRRANGDWRHGDAIAADFQHRQVLVRRQTNHARLVGAAVPQGDFGALGILHHVEIGDYVAAFIPDESGACP